MPKWLREFFWVGPEQVWWPDPIIAAIGAFVSTYLLVMRGWMVGVGALVGAIVVREILARIWKPKTPTDRN